MENQKSFKTIGILVFVGVLLLMGVYALAGWFILKDRRYSNSESSAGLPFGPHSGAYYAQMANHRQYKPHQPAEIDRLFQQAIVHSPVDSNIFAAYFEYLYARNCCIERAGKLIQAAVERSPASMRFYPAVVTSLLKAGEKEEAFRYFQKIVELKPKNIRRMISLAAENQLNPLDVIRLTPRNLEGLSALTDYLSRSGQNHKEEWLKAVEELHSLSAEPVYLLKTAEQAYRFHEIDLAKKYAILALAHPETAHGAKTLLTKIEKKKRL